MQIPCRMPYGMIDLARLSPDCFTAERIADCLSKVNRYNGRTPKPWPVASHSVLVSMLCPLELKAWGALHDAHEAIIGDIVTPVVQLIERNVGMAEERLVSVAINVTKLSIDEQIANAWGVTAAPRHPAIIHADRVALLAEMYLFMDHEEPDMTERERDDLDKALILISTLPSDDWRASRAVWLDRVHKLARQGLLTLPTEPTPPASAALAA